MKLNRVKIMDVIDLELGFKQIYNIIGIQIPDIIWATLRPHLIHINAEIRSSISDYIQ